MKQKTAKLLEHAKELYGDDSDFIIASHSNGRCSAATHGDINIVAETFFAAIHDPNNPMAKDFYRIIKLNVENILNNHSPYTIDLIQTFNKTFQADEN